MLVGCKIFTITCTVLVKRDSAEKKGDKGGSLSRRQEDRIDLLISHTRKNISLLYNQVYPF